jgi:hypothetical protein
VPVALLEARVREDPDDGELSGDDFLEIVLEFVCDFEGREVLELVDNLGKSCINLSNLGLTLLNIKVTQLDMLPLPDREIELFDEFPQLKIGRYEIFHIDGRSESGDCPLEVLLFVVEEGHFLDVLFGLVPVVLEVDEVLWVEFADLEGVDFHVGLA